MRPERELDERRIGVVPLRRARDLFQALHVPLPVVGHARAVVAAAEQPARVRAELTRDVPALGRVLDDHETPLVFMRAVRHAAHEIGRHGVRAVDAHAVAVVLAQPRVDGRAEVLLDLFLPEREPLPPPGIARPLEVNATVAILRPPVEFPQRVPVRRAVMQRDVHHHRDASFVRRIHQLGKLQRVAVRAVHGVHQTWVVPPRAAKLGVRQELQAVES